VLNPDPVPAHGQAEAIDVCPWLCSAPPGPSTPFNWPIFFFTDSLRLFMTIGAVALLVTSIWAIRHTNAPGQKLRFAAMALLCLTVAGTEINHLGDVPHWRFLVNLTGIALGLWGYHQHLFHELPATSKPRQDPSP
jgi:hypothetical protein